jgi:two-component system response regulator RegA
MVGQPRLLVVDDDEIMARRLSDAMDKRGFDADYALDLFEARKRIDEMRPSHAIVDLRIGRENGLDLIATLRDAEPDCRVLILSGYATTANAVSAVQLGALDVLVKPANADEIFEAFQAADFGKAPAPTHPTDIDFAERDHVRRVLHERDWNVTDSARALGMHRRTLQRVLRRWGIAPPEPGASLNG